MRAGVAPHQRRHRILDGFEERVREPRGDGHPERVAVEATVLGGDPALLARDPHLDDAPLGLELRQHRARRVALRDPLLALLRREVAEAPEDLLELVAIDGLRLLDAVLQRVLDVGQRRRIDQLAQLLLAEQLAQQVAVERQRRRPPLGVRRVALVHVGGDVVEEQRGGERRGALRLHLDERDAPRLEVAEDLAERRQVEDVPEDLAVGLERDREAREVLGDLEQGLRLEALLPQRRALARVGARDQQRAPGRLAEASAEEGRARELADDEVLDLVGVEQDEVGRGRLVGVGEMDDDPVVGPDRVGLELVLVADPRRQGKPPGGVDATAERREDAEPPVADLVAEALDDDRLVAGDDAGRGLLLAQVVRPGSRRRERRGRASSPARRAPC